MPKKAAEPFDLPLRLVEAYAINDRINTYLIQAIAPEAWQTKPAGGKGRTIAAMVAHMHNVRLMWLKAAGAAEMPPKLEPDGCTPGQAVESLQQSRAAIQEVLRQSLSSDGRVKGFKPDVAGFLGYLIAHDAHHRGQISMLSRQLGHPVSQSVMFGMWEWGTR